MIRALLIVLCSAAAIGGAFCMPTPMLLRGLEAMPFESARRFKFFQRKRH